MKRFHLITIFPEIFDSYLGESLMKRAREKKIVGVTAYNLRDFSNERHKKVDDRPFGGGPGMVLQIEPIYRAVRFVQQKQKIQQKLKTRTILFSTRGKKLDAKMAKRLSKYDDIIFICGRYEGVDERVAEHVADEEISIGDYVLSGGEIPALVTMEAVSRFIPGFLGKEESLEEINGSFPTYSRPEIFSPVPDAVRGQALAGARASKSSKTKKIAWKVPGVLLSGNHKKIEEWRKAKH